MHFSLYPDFKSFTSKSLNDIDYFTSYTKFGSLCLYLNDIDYMIRFRISAWDFQTTTSLVIFR